MGSFLDQVKVKRLGLKHRLFSEIYFSILRISWIQLIFYFLLSFILINSFFAVLYLIRPESIKNANPNSFFDAFVFSSQTFSTVGYGYLLPQTEYANVISVIENMSGIIFIAIITGLTFAKFSRPTAHVIFTDKLVITPFDGIPTLMGRIGNGRDTSIVDAKITLVTLKSHRTSEGIPIQRFVDLKLTRSQSPFFLLTWSFMHPIDKESPFYGFNEADFKEKNVNIYISLIGYEETYSETVHSGCRYESKDIHFNKKFVDVIHVLPDDTRVIDFEKFHSIENS